MTVHETQSQDSKILNNYEFLLHEGEEEEEHAAQERLRLMAEKLSLSFVLKDALCELNETQRILLDA